MAFALQAHLNAREAVPMRLTRNIHSFITPFGVESVFTAVLSSSAACYARPQARPRFAALQCTAACCLEFCMHWTAQAVLKPYLELFLRDELVAWQVPPERHLYAYMHACPSARPPLATAGSTTAPIVSLSALGSVVLCSGSTSGSDWSACKPGTTGDVSTLRIALPCARPNGTSDGVKSTVAIACRSRQRRFRRPSRRTSARSFNGAPLALAGVPSSGSERFDVVYSLDHLKHPADEGEAASKGTAATETLSLLCGKVVELISAATDPEKLKDMPPAWHPWF